MDIKPKVKTTTKIKVQPKPKPADERSLGSWKDLDSQLLDWDQSAVHMTLSLVQTLKWKPFAAVAQIGRAYDS